LCASVPASAEGEKGGSGGKLDPPAARPSCAAFSPDGKLVLVGFINTFPMARRAPSGRVIKMWDVKTRKELKTFSGHEGGVSWVSFFPDGRRIISSGDDGYFRIWDVATGEELWKAEGGGSPCALTIDGQQLLSLRGGLITHWRVGKEKLTKV